MTSTSANANSNCSNDQAKREYQLDDIWHLINQRAADAALQSLNTYTSKYPDYDHGWFAFSFLLFQLKRAESSLECIDKAIALSPTCSDWRIHRAHVLWLQNRLKEGQEELAKLVSLPDSKQLLVELASVSNKLSDYSMAEKTYLALLNIENQPQARAQLFFNLASVQRYLGKLSESEQNLNQAIELNTLDTEAILLRSSLKKQTLDSNHVASLQGLLTTNKLNPLQTSQLCYSLAKELEDLQQYDASFDYLAKGADSRRSTLRYQVEGDIEALAAIRDTFDSQYFQQKSKENAQLEQPADCTPIFIFGLPRTGSTLIERILSGHSEVTSAGELNHFSWQFMQQITKQFNTKPENKTATIGYSKRLDLSGLANGYLESTRPFWKNQRYFIDKLPLNSLNAGLIRGALPQAKMILVQRHPMDTCYAIYKHLFTQGYPFSYCLNELGQYYIAHHKLMQHWIQEMGEAIYQVRYEDLLAASQVQTKNMLAYCGLDFQPQCMAFEKNHQASTTASASQVRQGLYKDSLAKWRNYEKQLAPLLEQLQQAGIEI
ncbi:tetratricopeptide repeat-containing sulfotransferase family protein [Thalassotalea sp. PS06]|uniref:tetratricopeptide repeat-containing sulfotransferase family protein n=1 Tax=Thalassotalea sp. PS06 TaxID=2594005 RepID=UPI0011627B9F|nr:sulfotransferase [Thalassotalea sp. PS06]QDP02695.1 sulfotransferase [Thalassotalea sp. PS06]